MGRAFFARLLAFPVSAIASFATTALIIHEAGPEMYGVIMLVASIFLLVPFADLGTGAVIVNAFSEPGNTHASRTRVTAKVLRALVASALVITAVGWLGTVAWSWPGVLGIPRSTPWADVATATSITIYALSIPPSIGTRMLIGSGRVTTAILMAPLGSVGALLLCGLMVSGGIDPIWYTLTMPSGILISQCLALFLGLRTSRLAVRDLIGPSDFPTRDVLSSSVPMLVIMITLPFALYSHRIILSLVSTPHELARYSLAMQFYQPLWSFISAAATPLWPLWSSMRDQPGAARGGFNKALLALGALGVGSVIGLVLFGDWIGGVISGQTIQLGLPLLAVTGLLLVVQALQQAPGMFLTSAVGLRFQSYGAVLATFVSVAGSAKLSPHLGAVAPSVVTAAGVLVAQTVPGLVVVYRQFASDRATAPNLGEVRS